MTAQLVCRLHGGKSPQALAKAEERQAEAEAEAVLAETKLWVGLDQAVQVNDPATEIRRLAGTLKAMLDILGGKVNELRTVEAGDSLSQLRGIFLAADKVETKYQALLVKMSELGLAEQSLQLDREKARAVGLGITDGFEAMNASPEQRELFTAAFLSRVHLTEAVAS